MENPVKKTEKDSRKKARAPNDNRANAKAEKSAPETTPHMPDPVVLSRILMDVTERAQPLIHDFLEKNEFEFKEALLDPMNLRAAYAEFMQQIMANPQRFADMQVQFWKDWMLLCESSARKFMGEPADTLYAPDKGDRRFAAPAWQESAVFDFIKQSYLMTSRWLERLVGDTEGLDDETRQKLDFHTRQYLNALAPTNFLMTNPEVLKETIDSGGENLIRGLQNLLEDLERGHGELAISTTDYAAFEIGRNLAVTPGKVVYQNDLMQLIQYTPATETVFKKPLLVVPPWINKYYILDLRPENSFIRWIVAQGHTVFTISWVNPDRELARKRFEDYMQEGILTALDEIRKITGETQCNALGYCLGGTLLATTLSWLAAHGKSDKVSSATLLTTLIDFEKAGEMKLFIDDSQLQLMEKEMAEKGFLSAERLKKTFSLLRANDLIWSFVVNNYLMGREPFPFDLLYWNDDATNMPAEMHSFYLRKLYRENLLREPGGLTMNGTPIDISRIDTPCYFLSTKEDHIAPWKATYAATQLIKSSCRFTLAASGHVAGVVNHPDKKKYCFWTNGKTPSDCEDWLEEALAQDGSWWPDWAKWAESHGGPRIPAQPIKGAGLEDAPGSYVKAKA